MLLLTLGVCVVIFSNVEAGIAPQKFCLDCMPFYNCKNAKNLIDREKNEHTRQLIQKSFCGLRNRTVEICCSEFDAVPTINIRSFGHPNLGLLPPSCGVIAQDRIVGGVEAGIFEFPWMAVLAYGDDKKFGCAGTLINSRYVLTAAHCVVNKEITNVRIGDFNLVQELDCQGNICERHVQNFEVEEDDVHDDYDPSNFRNDIALLRLKSSASYPKRNVNAICLPTTREMQQQTITNKLATVCGWGLDEHGNKFSILRKVDINVLPNSYCEEYYSHLSESNHNQFCAGEPKKDSCRGDSGGPLMLDIDMGPITKIVQYGIVSHGPHRCGEQGPGIYTDVRQYINWILDHIKE